MEKVAVKISDRQRFILSGGGTDAVDYKEK